MVISFSVLPFNVRTIRGGPAYEACPSVLADRMSAASSGRGSTGRSMCCTDRGHDSAFAIASSTSRSTTPGHPAESWYRRLHTSSGMIDSGLALPPARNLANRYSRVSSAVIGPRKKLPVSRPPMLAVAGAFTMDSMERSLASTNRSALRALIRHSASSHSIRNALGFMACVFSTISNGGRPAAVCCNANTRNMLASSLSELN
jgi:hypothetical protein